VSRYRICKSGQTWQLYRWYGLKSEWYGPVMESSSWRAVAWVATGDPKYRIAGAALWPVKQDYARQPGTGDM
jgi:hypothetical protein